VSMDRDFSDCTILNVIGLLCGLARRGGEPSALVRRRHCTMLSTRANYDDRDGAPEPFCPLLTSKCVGSEGAETDGVNPARGPVRPSLRRPRHDEQHAQHNCWLRRVGN